MKVINQKESVQSRVIVVRNYLVITVRIFLKC